MKGDGRSIVFYCDRSIMQLFCICLVVYCFKVLVITLVVVRLANQRAASSSCLSIHVHLLCWVCKAYSHNLSWFSQLKMCFENLRHYIVNWN